MKDLEICKKIAEIEGEHVTEVECSDGSWLCSELCNEYNPLTDDDLCFKLMIKHRVALFVSESGNCSVTNYSHNRTLARNESPNKAICLAIIEAHKE